MKGQLQMTNSMIGAGCMGIGATITAMGMTKGVQSLDLFPGVPPAFHLVAGPALFGMGVMFTILPETKKKP